MRLTASLCFILLISVAPAASAQSEPWWSVDIRKTFDGSANEGEPASVGWVDPGPDSAAYWLLDGGVRLKPRRVDLGDSSAGTYPAHLDWSPNVEWHYFSAEPLARQEATNAGGAALNLEIWQGGDPLRDKPMFSIVGKGAVTRDALNDVTTNAVSLLVSAYQSAEATTTGGFRPGSPIQVERSCTSPGICVYPLVTYFPYVGFEYFRNLAITRGDDTLAPLYDGGNLLAKVDFEATPFHHVNTLPGRIAFVVSGKYEYRHLLKDHPAVGTQNPQFGNVTLSYYFVTDRRVGFGLSIDKGRGPAMNLVSQRRIALVLKAKL